MRAIQIDDEVFRILKDEAEPFVDKSPNDVLRRLLGLNSREVTRDGRDTERSRGRGANDVQGFLERILKEEFGSEFRVMSPYRTMYQSRNRVVYFQNFNKSGTSNLWYRLKGTALESLRAEERKSFVVFTNPADRFAYLIPLQDLEKRIAESGWDREDLEVNIDPGENRWRELNWELDKYLRRYPLEMNA